MSLSPLVSFKSRFVTYLLNFPRKKHSTNFQDTVNTSTFTTKIPTHTHTDTLQNKLKQPQYKVHPNDIVTI